MNNTVGNGNTELTTHTTPAFLWRSAHECPFGCDEFADVDSKCDDCALSAGAPRGHHPDCPGCDACDSAYAGEVAERLSNPPPWDATLADVLEGVL